MIIESLHQREKGYFQIRTRDVSLSWTVAWSTVLVSDPVISGV